MPGSGHVLGEGAAGGTALLVRMVSEDTLQLQDISLV